jgi:hypothetical protein
VGGTRWHVDRCRRELERKRLRWRRRRHAKLRHKRLCANDTTSTCAPLLAPTPTPRDQLPRPLPAPPEERKQEAPPALMDVSSDEETNAENLGRRHASAWRTDSSDDSSEDEVLEMTSQTDSDADADAEEDEPKADSDADAEEDSPPVLQPASLLEQVLKRLRQNRALRLQEETAEELVLDLPRKSSTGMQGSPREVTGCRPISTQADDAGMSVPAREGYSSPHLRATPASYTAEQDTNAKQKRLTKRRRSSACADLTDKRHPSVRGHLDVPYLPGASATAASSGLAAGESLTAPSAPSLALPSSCS